MKGKNSESEDFDVYAYAHGADGNYIITKNGDFFLTCTGSEEDAKNLVKIIQEDANRARCG